MKVETFKELLVELGKFKESAFIVFKKEQDCAFIYKDETGEIQEKVIDLTGLFTEELGEFIFDNYACKQEKCNFYEDFMIAGSLGMCIELIVHSRIY